jgi:signal peptidase I
MNKKFWTEGVGSFLLAIGVALTVRWAFVEAYVIPSGSMLPTLLINDHIFVNKFVYGLRLPFTEKWLFSLGHPKKGDVVVFKYPENKSQFYIKRVVGTPGDRVYYENGNLYINDELVEKYPPIEKKSEFKWLTDEDFKGEGEEALANYSHWEERLGGKSYSTLQRKGKSSFSFGPYQVPEGHFFVMGDNRDNSQDSRLWSEDKRFVPYSYLVGRAMFVWLSCTHTMPVVSFLCDPREIRADRFFKGIE